ncbi:PQ-loop repeat-containing protein 3 [Tupaia chinensis]|uniref:PQ-loop repeat-containing protein 3 n=1 Tax=Tupaia chinensis TaxID=246437 RepID=L9LAS4_TUPCH|nr:PQ-loop repeat-containing protein 3 [Tupaia chinensis]
MQGNARCRDWEPGGSLEGILGTHWLDVQCSECEKGASEPLGPRDLQVGAVEVCGAEPFLEHAGPEALGSAHAAMRVFLVFLRYQWYYGYPLLTYLEYPILIAQDVILLLCFFHFSGNVKQAAPVMAVYPFIPTLSSPGMASRCKTRDQTAYGSAALQAQASLVTGVGNSTLERRVSLVSSWFVLGLQKWIIDLAMNFCTFISAASKFLQLHYLWKTRDAGAVSALSWGLAAYTCATRIVTTLMTTNDFTILIRFVVMLFLNLLVTATVLHYQKTVKAE